MARRGLFYEVLTAAVADITAHGFDSQERLERWLGKLRVAARDMLVPQSVLERSLRDALGRVYRRAVEGRLLKTNPGLPSFTIERLKPALRAELDRRLLANVNLITFNREASIQKAMQRFAGWASSIPAGGSKAVDKRDTKDDIRRGIAGLSFEERRCTIDQGHKLASALNDIVCRDGGAIAYLWHHVKEHLPAYDARPEHVARDGKIYVIRDNWALQAGLMKLAGHQYYDEVTAAAEEPFCRCSVQGLFTLRQLPADMLTARGKLAQEETRHAA